MMRELSPTIRQSRRDRILQVATEVFFADGYAAATMSTISHRLGGSKATLYAYFPSKDDLLEAIMRRQCGTLFAALEAADALPGLPARLLHLGAAFLRVMVSDAGVRTLQLGIEAARDQPDLARRFEEAAMRPVDAQLTDLLALAAARGEIDAPDPAAAARAFFSLLRGDLHFRRLLNLIPEPDAASLDAEVRAAVTVFLRAFGAGE
jgi:AcrR family transcriptional regulator